MDSLLHKFGSIIKGSIEGFDRLVFKGTVKSISFALGMQAFLSSYEEQRDGTLVSLIMFLYN